MKKYLFLLYLLVMPSWCHLRAQTVCKDKETVKVEVADSLDGHQSSVPLMFPSPRSLFLLSAPGFDGCSPWYMGTYGPSWDLHEGFNAQLGMSLSTGFGSNAPSGVGFGQTANLAYALPLNKQFSVAAGLYLQNMDWGNFHQRDVGFSAALGFKINEIVSLYAYGTKSFLPNHHCCPMGIYPLSFNQFRDRLGAMAEFKLGENAKIQVSVERSSGGSWDIPMYALPERMHP